MIEFWPAKVTGLIEPALTIAALIGTAIAADPIRRATSHIHLKNECVSEFRRRIRACARAPFGR
jgi:hypothetical protein